jgi:hypothetical protein
MTPVSEHTFDCQLYVPARGLMKAQLPPESGPVHIARFQPLRYDELVDPGFRRLLAAFESVPRPLKLVQV